MGSRGRRADPDRQRRRLLPPGHPAHAPRRHRPGRHRLRRGPLARHRAGLRRPARRGSGAAMSRAIRIGNCSGFYGDRLSAMREKLEGGGLDVITGDYLAELTMLILGKDQLKDPTLGYARTFVRQVEDCLGLALESGVKIVSNAGGLNPAGLADKLREVAQGLGLDPRSPTSRATTSGTSRLRRGAHRQRLPRRLRHRRRPPRRRRRRRHRARHRRLARRRPGDRAPRLETDVVRRAGGRGRCRPRHRVRHPGDRRQLQRLPRPCRDLADRPLGFPSAEVAADGSSVITKHDGTGGAVTVDTVTAQLVYEIQSERYLGPDVTVHLDSIRLEPGRARTASRSPASAARRRPSGSRSASTSSAAGATPSSSC